MLPGIGFLILFASFDLDGYKGELGTVFLLIVSSVNLKIHNIPFYFHYTWCWIKLCMAIYCIRPNIRPWAYTFKRLSLMHLYSGGLIFGLDFALMFRWIFFWVDFFELAHIRVGSYSGGLIFGWAHIRVGSYSSGLIFEWAHIRVGSDSSLLGFQSARIPVCSDSSLLGFQSARIPVCSDSSLLGFQSARIPVCSDSSLLGFQSAQISMGGKSPEGVWWISDNSKGIFCMWIVWIVCGGRDYVPPDKDYFNNLSINCYKYFSVYFTCVRLDNWKNITCKDLLGQISLFLMSILWNFRNLLLVFINCAGANVFFCTILNKLYHTRDFNA